MKERTATMHWEGWLTRKEASDYLRSEHGIRLSVSALAAAACRGDGPPFAREGRMTTYPRAELDAWAKKRRSRLVHSTREWRQLRAQAVDIQAA